MPRKQIESIAVDQANALQNAISDLQDLPRPGVAALPIIRGLSKDCTTSSNLENKLAEVTDILVRSERVYSFGNGVMLEEGEGCGKRLTTLMSGGELESAAAAKLGTVFKCEIQGKESRSQFPPSVPIVTSVLHSKFTKESLPVVRTYADRPVYDRHFKLRSPGWHPDIGLLVHGFEVEVNPVDRATGADALKAVQRLPRHLKSLLEEFPFATEADLANALGTLLTIPLMPLFIEDLHPLIIMDSNQPGSGKTEFAKLIGILCDGEASIVRPFTRDDEELRKDIGASLRSRSAGCIVLDNAKRGVGEPVKSEVLEAMSTSSRLSFRILGKSEVYERPNDILCVITMNDARLSADLIDRGLTIQLAVDGATRKRKYKGKPLKYATAHRREILAELISMIELWKQEGQPRAHREYRFREWAEVIGGILEVNGYPEFLTNVERVANSQSTELDELAALAETAHRKHKDAGYCWPQPASSGEGSAETAPPKGIIAAKWEPVFKDAEVMQDKLLASKSAGSKGKMIGNYFSRFVDSEVSIRRGDKEGTATLRQVNGQGGKHYYFEIRGEAAAGTVDAPDTLLAEPPKRTPLPTGPAVKSISHKPSLVIATTIPKMKSHVATSPLDTIKGGQQA